MNNIAVFIDSDNINYKYYDYIYNYIKNLGDIYIHQCFSDWSRIDSKEWKNICNNNGIQPIQVNHISKKNSTDLKMTCDIAEILFNNNNINIFILITSDSDFSHIINLIKKNNKLVYCIGNQNSNKYLQKVCHKYISIESILSNNSINKKRKIINITNKKIVNKNNNDINQYIYKFDTDIKKIINKNNKPIQLSYINDYISKQYKFDYKNYGFNKFITFFNTYFNNYKLKFDKNGCFVYL